MMGYCFLKMMIRPFHHRIAQWWPGVLIMEGIQTAEIGPRQCRHLLPFKEGKFGGVWALDGSNSNYQTRHVSNSTTDS